MPKMKDSGIDWIGEIPENWTCKRMRYFVNISSGTLIGKDEYTDDGKYPIIGSNGEIGRSNKVNNIKSVITTGRVGTIGTVHIVKESWITDNALIITENNINQRYLSYIIPNFDYRFMLSGTAQPLITATKLKNQSIPIPPLKRQCAIANFLDQKCSEIDFLYSDIEKEIETLEEYKKSVITEAVTKGLNPDVEMKDSGIEWIGLVNDDYEIKKLKYVCKILDEFRQPVTAHLRSQDSEILYDYYGASGAIDKIDGYTINDDVLLIGEDGANLKMRNLPLIYQVHGKAWINNHAHILKPIYNVLDYTYAYFMLESLDINPYITGSAQPKFNQEQLKNMHVIVPPMQEQQKIAQYLSERCKVLDAVIADKKAQLKTLAEYKKSLIYEYVTGKKAVPKEILAEAIDPNAVLLGVIVNKLKEYQTGRIQLQKILFLANMHLGLNQKVQYYRYNHGPYDMHLNNYIDDLTKNHWYEEKIEKSSLLVKGTANDNFLKGNKEEIENYSSKIVELLNLLYRMNSLKRSRLERITTLYAVWNDFLLDGVKPTDDQLINEVMNNWTENKGNTQYATWKDTLTKMKKNGLIPKGTGKHTIPKKH